MRLVGVGDVATILGPPENMHLLGDLQFGLCYLHLRLAQVGASRICLPFHLAYGTTKYRVPTFCSLLIKGWSDKPL